MASIRIRWGIHSVGEILALAYAWGMLASACQLFWHVIDGLNRLHASLAANQQAIRLVQQLSGRLQHMGYWRCDHYEQGQDAPIQLFTRDRPPPYVSGNLSPVLVLKACDADNRHHPMPVAYYVAQTHHPHHPKRLLGSALVTKTANGPEQVWLTGIASIDFKLYSGEIPMINPPPLPKHTESKALRGISIRFEVCWVPSFPSWRNLKSVCEPWSFFVNLSQLEV